jgi:predicted DNA-binding transcriptional regulator AlpA
VDDGEVEYIDPTPYPHEPFVDKHAVAELLNVSTKWVDTRATDRSFPSHKVGNLRRYRLSEVVAWVREQDDGGRSPTGARAR